jgi:hypothetical protein
LTFEAKGSEPGKEHGAYHSFATSNDRHQARHQIASVASEIEHRTASYHLRPHSRNVTPEVTALGWKIVLEGQVHHGFIHLQPSAKVFVVGRLDMERCSGLPYEPVATFALALLRT